MRKRIISILLVVAMLFCLAFSLGGCGKRGKCDECGQTEALKKYEARDGDVYWLCKDCYRLYKWLYS